jgi:hypothetical protein
MVAPSLVTVTSPLVVAVGPRWEQRCVDEVRSKGFRERMESKLEGCLMMFVRSPRILVPCVGRVGGCWGAAADLPS